MALCFCKDVDKVALNREHKTTSVDIGTHSVGEGKGVCKRKSED